MLRPVCCSCSPCLPVRPPDTVRWRYPEGSDQNCDSRRVRILALHFRTEALPVALLDEVVHQFTGTVVHLDVERLYLAGEVVERHNRRDGDEKTECRRYQSFRDTAGDCADTGGFLRCNLLEGVQ